MSVKVKKSKTVEIEEFRAEVNNYLETGKSSLLTDAEKISLDKSRSRPRPSLFKNIASFFLKK